MSDINYFNSNYLIRLKDFILNSIAESDKINLLNNWLDKVSFILEIDPRLNCFVVMDNTFHDIYLDKILNDILVLFERIYQVSLPTISAVIIVKDEERCIYRCIESILDYVDEIVIVDTGSTDSTMDIINSIVSDKIKTYSTPWENDFSHARNFAKRKAKKDWLMFIDADEYLDGKGDYNEVKEILLILQFLSIKNEMVICPFISNHNGYNVTTVRRFFLNNTDINYFGLVHEEPRINNTKPYYISVNIAFIHDGYMHEIVKNKRKTDRNLSLLSKMMLLEPNNLRWKYFYYRDGIEVIDLLNAEVGIKSSLILNEQYDFSKSNIREDEFTFALLDLLAKNNLRQSKFDDVDIITDIMNCFLPENSNSYYYKCLINIVELKSKYKELLDKTILYRERNIDPQYGMIHSEGYHIDALISILLFDNNYISQAAKYFDFLNSINFNSDILNEYKSKIKQIKSL